MIEFKLSDPHFLPHIGCQVCFDIMPGQVTVLSGDNGIGKSTLLHKIFRDSLHLSLTLSDQRPLDIFFDRKIKVFKELLFHGSEKLNKTFFEKYWALSGLSGKEDRFLSQLSGGEAQVLKMISVCSGQADIYLLDEPGQYLDSEKKNLINKMLEEISGAGKAILVVEHESSWLSKNKSLRMIVEDNLLRVKNS